MAVKIKLKRLGKIREPYYRVVIADSRTKRDGRAIEEIGKYHPKLEPSLIEIDSERAQYWLSVGAQPTDSVRHLLTITGDWQKFKGLPGAEGTLKTGESKADKKDRYEELVKESLAAKEAKAAAKPARTPKRDTKKAEPAPEKAEPAPEEAPAAAAAEAPAAEAAAGRVPLRPSQPSPKCLRKPSITWCGASSATRTTSGWSAACSAGATYSKSASTPMTWARSSAGVAGPPGRCGP